MKKEIIIPTEWSEVKYSTFYNYIKQTEGEDDPKVMMEIALYYLVGLEPKDYYGLKPEVFADINNTLADLLNKQDKQPLVKKLVIEGVEYGFEPNLQEMSYGAYIDLSTYSKDLWKNMPIIASILYRPIQTEVGKQYQIQKYSGTDDNTIQVFKKNLTMDICLGMVGFFLILKRHLLNHFLISSQKEITQMMKDQKIIQHLEDLEISGEFIKQSLHLLEEISSGSIQ